MQEVKPTGQCGHMKWLNQTGKREKCLKICFCHSISTDLIHTVCEAYVTCGKPETV